MHSCEEVPSERGKEDQGCLDWLTANYSFLYRVGDKETVSASLVFKLSQTPQEVAVKVMPGGEVKDVKISCMLNGLTETPCFVKTFGWIKCSQIPPLWMKGLNMKRDAPKSLAASKMFLFQVMAFSPHAWADERIQLNLEEYRAMLFLLLHALWVAHKKFSFRHNDMHKGQILFQTCKPNTSIEIVVGENHYWIPCQRFVPKLIDFGLATLEEEESDDDDATASSEGEGMFEREPGDDMHDDLRNLFYMFDERMEADGLVPFKRNKSLTKLDDIILNDSIFESLRRNTSNTSSIQSRYVCDVCFSAATVQWEGKPFYFCGEECASSYIK